MGSAPSSFVFRPSSSRSVAMQRTRSIAAALAGLPFGLIYGITARMVFGSDQFPGYFSTMSIAFLFLVPLAVGALTVGLAPAKQRESWVYAICMPLASCGIALLVIGALAWEVLICLVMAAPIVAAMGSLGGVIVCALARSRARRRGMTTNATIVGVLLLSPYLGALVERRVPTVDRLAETQTQITIHASPEVVWRTIIRVPRIQPAERSYSLLFDLFGAPRPLEAMLDRDGQGALRRGMFEDNVVFLEQITRWEPERRIEWAITVGDRAAVPAPWNEIGGRYFAVTGAGYRIEPVDANTVVLHLASTARLTTHFNGYAALWARWGLGEFQGQVLRVIKARAEAQAAAGAGIGPGPAAAQSRIPR
jgi:hypothetical protein